MHTGRNQRVTVPAFTVASFLIAGAVLAGCGSDGSDSDAAPNDGASVASETSSDAAPSSDQLNELDEARGELEDLVESGNLGSGGGVVTIQGVDYPFAAETCFVEDMFFDTQGPGQTADGELFWASISYGVETREEMESVGLPQAGIDAYFGDKDSLETFTLEVEMGKDSMFGGGDDLKADFRLDVIDAAASDNVTFVADGRTISGSGSILDYNGVLIEINEQAPVAFSASCD